MRTVIFAASFFIASAFAYPDPVNFTMTNSTDSNFCVSEYKNHCDVQMPAHSVTNFFCPDTFCIFYFYQKTSEIAYASFSMNPIYPIYYTAQYPNKNGKCPYQMSVSSSTKISIYDSLNKGQECWE